MTIQPIVVPTTCPDDWRPDTYKLIHSAYEYTLSPEPPSRASILSSRLIEVADATKHAEIRDITLQLLNDPVLSKGSRTEKWALGAYFSLKDRRHIPIFLNILGSARDSILLERAEALSRAFKKRLEPVCVHHIVIALRLEQHTNHNITSSLLSELPAPSQHDAQKIQETIFTHWLMPSSNGVRGVAFLRQLYAKLDILSKMHTLRHFPTKPSNNVLPFLATLAQENIPSQHHLVLELAQNIGHRDAEPLILILLDSPHDKILNKAAEVAAEVGTRRCLTKLQYANERAETRSTIKQLNAAIEAIEQRHPDQHIEEGALSLSITQGPSGALSLSEEEEGALSLYDRVALGGKHALTTSSPNTALQVLQPWQHLEPAPRAMPSGIIPTMFFQYRPIFAIIAIVILFGSLGVLMIILSDLVVSGTPIEDGGNVIFFIYGNVGGLIANFALLISTMNKAKLVEKGLLAEATPHGVEAIDSPNQQGQAWSHNYLCTDINGQTSKKKIIKDFSSSMSPESVPVLIGDDDKSILFLDSLRSMIKSDGSIKSSRIWSLLMVGLIVSYLGGWAYIFHLLTLIPK